jgi:hypothetical protein
LRSLGLSVDLPLSTLDLITPTRPPVRSATVVDHPYSHPHYLASIALFHRHHRLEDIGGNSLRSRSTQISQFRPTKLTHSVNRANPIPANLLLPEVSPNLLAIAQVGVGYDSIDIDSCRERRIAVTSEWCDVVRCGHRLDKIDRAVW